MVHYSNEIFTFSAYYRVNYDDILWTKIKAALKSEHERIHILNRAQIVDDALNLAWGKVLNYSQAFSILTYLKYETEYYPWYSVINGLSSLQRLYGEDSEIFESLRKFELELLEGVLKNVSFLEPNDSNQLHSLKLNLILSRACRLNETNSVETAKQLFTTYKNETR